jgi:hypothetical protein
MPKIWTLQTKKTTKINRKPINRKIPCVYRLEALIRWHHLQIDVHIASFSNSYRKLYKNSQNNFPKDQIGEPKKTDLKFKTLLQKSVPCDIGKRIDIHLNGKEYRLQE